jgi:hypothetical protein
MTLRFLLIPFLGLSLALNAQSFEGVITYKVKLGFKEDFPQKYHVPFRQRYGDTLLVYYRANGDQYRHYPNSGRKEGYDFQIYRSDSSVNYLKWRFNDTIFHFDASVNSLDLFTKGSGPKLKVMGQDCQSIVITGIHKKMKTTVRLFYVYSGKPMLDPKMFEGFQDFFMADLISETKSPPLKMQLDLGDFFIIYEAVAIEEKKVEAALFEIKGPLAEME